MRDPDSAAPRAAFGDFLDDLVHELRTPLTGLAGYAALLAEEGRLLPPELRHAADVVDVQSQRLGAQLALLLEIARLWSGRTSLTLRRTNLAALVRAAARRHGAMVESPERLTLLGDSTLLRRALEFLLDNAGRHGAPPATIALCRDGARARVCVSDHGLGLPPRRAEDAGVRPFQAPPRDGPPRGTGLSLVFAAAVAERHGGALSYARVDGVSCFTLSLRSAHRTSTSGNRG